VIGLIFRLVKELDESWACSESSPCQGSAGRIGLSEECWTWLNRNSSSKRYNSVFFSDVVEVKSRLFTYFYRKFAHLQRCC
jgi:hypothetical protein